MTKAVNIPPKFPTPRTPSEARDSLPAWEQAGMVRLMAQVLAADSAPAAPGANAGPAGNARTAARKMSGVEQLTHWVHWTDAIALSGALASAADTAHAADRQARTAGPLPGSGRGGPMCRDETSSAALRAGLEQWRAAMVTAIEDESQLPARAGSRGSPAAARAAAAAASAADVECLTAYRRHAIDRQNDMETGAAAWRARLREALAGHPGRPCPAMPCQPDGARERAGSAHGAAPATGRGTQLAALDAALEAALRPKQRLLLGQVPSLLDRHFRQQTMGTAERGEPSEPSANSATSPRDARCRQLLMQSLRAELDLRLQPLLALLAALEQLESETRPAAAASASDPVFTGGQGTIGSPA